MRPFSVNTKRGGLTTLDVGDLVEWSVLDISVNDYQDIFKRIHSGDLLNNIAVSSFTTCNTHTGFVSEIVEDYIVVMEFVGRKETSFLREDVLSILQVLNRSADK